MKSVMDLKKSLNEHMDFRVMETSLDGGMGIFTRGSLKGATVIWSCAGGWEHVSICSKNRTPDWDEMCMLKDMFWDADETAMQLHPPKANYVNNMRNCLHLWKPIEQFSGSIPLPPDVMVGIKAVGNLV